DDDLPLKPLGELPIEALAGAAVQLAGGTVQEQRLGIAVVLSFEVEAGADLERLPKPANRVRIPGSFLAVQLRDMELRNQEGFLDLPPRRVDEYADPQHSHGCPDVPCLVPGEVSRALLVEVEADRRGACVHR